MRKNNKMESEKNIKLRDGEISLYGSRYVEITDLKGMVGKTIEEASLLDDRCGARFVLDDGSVYVFLSYIDEHQEIITKAFRMILES